MKGPVFPLLLVIFISGCAVGPNYKKPAINTPTVYRGLTPDEAGKTDAKSLADEKWWEVFQDEQLKELIRTALQQNYDVRRAASSRPPVERHIHCSPEMHRWAYRRLILAARIRCIDHCRIKPRRRWRHGIQ